MKFAAASLIVFALLCSALPNRGQGLQVDAEAFRRLQGEVADLRDAKAADQKRIAELNRRIDHLQSALREANERTTLKLGDAITRDDLKKIVDRIAEVDEAREKDRKLILAQFDALEKALKSGSARPVRRESRETEEEPVQIEGTFYPHKVESGETLGEIIQAYNAALKQEGRPPITFSQVKKVNPKLDLNRIRVGQEILLPVPDKK